MNYKYYDNKVIRDFIKNNENIIEEVVVGMAEDWFWTASTIWENGDYVEGI